MYQQLKPVTMMENHNVLYFRLHGLKPCQQSYTEFTRLVYKINFEQQITDKATCINNLQRYLQLNDNHPKMPKENYFRRGVHNLAW